MKIFNRLCLVLLLAVVCLGAGAEGLFADGPYILYGRGTAVQVIRVTAQGRIEKE